MDLDRVGTDWDTIHPNIKDILLGWGDLAAASSLGIEENQNYFPLMHGDLSPGNIILNNDCDVVGIIDWSWSSTVPSQVFGAQRTPFSGALNFIRQTPENMAEAANYFSQMLQDHLQTLGVDAFQGSLDSEIIRFLVCPRMLRHQNGLRFLCLVFAETEEEVVGRIVPFVKPYLLSGSTVASQCR